MSDITFLSGKLKDSPEAEQLNRAYRKELAAKNMPTTWPDSDLYHYHCLLYNDEPMVLCLFAPLPGEKYRAVYSAGAYTRPSWRRLGLYSDLMQISINDWRIENKYDWFMSGFHKNNHSSRAMQISQGREIYEESGDYWRTRLSLRPTGEEFELTKETLQPILNKFDQLA